jgi:rfaE bifunctional protein nucleotidyltransferase chain/domain
VDYLVKAADLGDVLIIGLNSDPSVRMLNKGSNRPIQDQHSRALILSSFVFVSAVSIFDELTPEKLIEAVQPDILVKGGDYKEEDIAGAKYVRSKGGKVAIIPLVPGYSTSAIEKKIRSS